MHEIKIPEEELRKLEETVGLKIFSSDESDVYKTIVDMVSILMECPIAGITLYNPPARQWFTSPAGFTYSEAPNTGLFYEAMLKEPLKPLIVTNTLLDPRFVKDPSVTEGLLIRFAIGICLLDPKNKVIGILSMADNVPRQAPSNFEIDSLIYIAKFTSLLVQLREFIVDIYEEIQDLKKMPDLNFKEEETQNLFSKLDEALEKVKSRRKYFK